MAIINRLTRLFRADFHAVLDRIEEPEQVLKQAIRDMEDELAGTEQRAQLWAHDHQLLLQRRTELGTQVTEIDEELDLCFSRNKDELARSLVRRKLEVERLVKHLDAKLASGEETLQLERARLEENRATLDGLKQKAEIFARRTPTGPGMDPDIDDNAWMARELTVSEDEIEVAFLREQQARAIS